MIKDEKYLASNYGGFNPDAPTFGSVQADPGPETGQTEVLSAFVDSWTQSFGQEQVNAEPLPTADPGKRYISLR